MASNPFTHHPKEVGESYSEHFTMAAGFGFQMIGAGLAALVHAVFPFLFIETGSRTLRRLHGRLTSRADKPNWERHPII